MIFLLCGEIRILLLSDRFLNHFIHDFEKKLIFKMIRQLIFYFQTTK